VDVRRRPAAVLRRRDPLRRTLFGVVALVLGFLHYRTRVSAGREQAALVFVGGQLAWLAIVLVQNGLFGTPK